MHAVHRVVLDHEIDCFLALAGDARAHAGITGLQRALLEARIVAADGFVKTRFAALVNAVIETVAPREVGPEFAAVAEIISLTFRKERTSRTKVRAMIGSEKNVVSIRNFGKCSL